MSLGLSSKQQPLVDLSCNQPLKPSSAYYVWVEVGANAVPGALHASPLPPIHSGAILEVFLFSNEPEVKLRHPCSALIEVVGESSARVTRRSTTPNGVDDAAILNRRVFFSFFTPKSENYYRLRLCIYCHKVLVQSQEIRVNVQRSTDYQEEAITIRGDYSLTRTLADNHLAHIIPHRVSLMINRAEDGTHGFHFLGESDFSTTATIDAWTAQSMIKQVRAVLQEVSWGKPEPWKKGYKFRYEKGVGFNHLGKDLIKLAKVGYDSYDQIIHNFTNGEVDAEALAELMRIPGLVQLALKSEGRLFLPLAIIYDHKLDTGQPDKNLHLCDSFQKSTVDEGPLQDQECFIGKCPNRENDKVVCPSGFWGFRHLIGIPISIGTGKDEADHVPGIINQIDKPEVTIGVCTDPQFKRREPHMMKLRRIFKGGHVHEADTRNAVINLMKDVSSQAIYFYCHGGRNGQTPFIKVGDLKGPELRRSTLRDKKVKWSQSRPLVFINGCHTTDLEPDKAFDLVSGFIRTAGASGVIGTEITIFERLAVDFAEEFFRAFTREGKSVAESIKIARIHLLKAKLNPLGLVYVPFALANLCLTAPHFEKVTSN